MKKVAAILVLALFVGGIGMVAYAATTDAPVAIEQTDDKKKKTTEKEATKKSSDCSKSCEGEKKSDCSKKCEGESKK